MNNIVHWVDFKDAVFEKQWIGLHSRFMVNFKSNTFQFPKNDFRLSTCHTVIRTIGLLMIKETVTLEQS